MAYPIPSLTATLNSPVLIVPGNFDLSTVKPGALVHIGQQAPVIAQGGTASVDGQSTIILQENWKYSTVTDSAVVEIGGSALQTAVQEVVNTRETLTGVLTKHRDLLVEDNPALEIKISEQETVTTPTWPNLKSQVQQQLSQLQIIGDGSVGTRTINAAAGVFTTDANVYQKMYYHIKLPLRAGIDTGMFRIELKGYHFGEPKMIQDGFAGYVHWNNPNAFAIDVDGTSNPAIYTGTDNHVYCRIETVSSAYYMTLSVDSMYVGNGRVINPGEITITESTEATL